MALSISGVGDVIGDVLTGIGDNFQASADDAQSRAKYNDAVATLLLSRASGERQISGAYTKAINIVAGGLIAALILFIFAKFVLPKIK